MSSALDVPVTADHARLPYTGRPGPVDYAAASKAANTWRAYRTDWSQWSAWCAVTTSFSCQQPNHSSG